ncbi:transcription termination/antitermination NusG family protein [uncultured Ruminococcus sp.]|uniref:transcription termination/antitermination NusG family protein n=1 Tax=uncultured Ruminococcus sp. TaxID=165186 RepID=UPI0026011737|nr:transcription termination/antitermination NusG family protein [uncultured Ruminococcus sp.]
MINNHKWYVLHVRTGSELDIAEQLRKRGFSAVVPTENRVIRKGGKWTQKIYIVFAGYVFIYMDYSWSKYYAMSGIYGIIKILGGGQNPTPLSKSETEFILKLSELLVQPSVLKFKDDNSYEVISGFLADYTDNITKVERRYKKATVKVTVAGEEKEIKVSFVEDTEQTPEQTED